MEIGDKCPARWEANRFQFKLLELNKNCGLSHAAKIAERNLVDFIIGVGKFNVVVAHLFGYDRYDLNEFPVTEKAAPHSNGGGSPRSK